MVCPEVAGVVGPPVVGLMRERVQLEHPNRTSDDVDARGAEQNAVPAACLLARRC
jgi:hypothetical protein